MTALRIELRPAASLASLLLLVVLGGCANIEEDTTYDPLEDVNRTIFGFNQTVDKVVLKPVAEGYKAVTPNFLNLAITNFFNNLADFGNAANNLLQLKFAAAVEDVGRIVVNSTFGLGGLIDFASGIGIQRHSEDFGQTIGYWGIDAGPYLVLPFLGPSNLRDTVGRGVDVVFLDPVSRIGGHDTLEYSLVALRVVDTRADLLGAQALLSVAAWDEYSFVREAYTQRRESLIRDGAPGPE